MTDDMKAPELLPCPFCGTTEMLRIVGASGGYSADQFAS